MNLQNLSIRKILFFAIFRYSRYLFLVSIFLIETLIIFVIDKIARYMVVSKFYVESSKLEVE